MINTLKTLLGIGPKVNYQELISNGARIIDVRTKGEFASGHIKGSFNIPLTDLSKGVVKINKQDVIVTCCASGMRSASAKSTLKSLGYTNVYNGGGWHSLKAKL